MVSLSWNVFNLMSKGADDINCSFNAYFGHNTWWILKSIVAEMRGLRCIRIKICKDAKLFIIS